MTPQAKARESSVVSASLCSLFFLTRRARWALRALRPLAVPFVAMYSLTLRENLRFNSARIFGRNLCPREQRAFAKGVVGNFYDFVSELGASGNESFEQMLSRVETVEGEPAYLEARKRKRGAVLVTAHMGAFEVGLAALRRVEPHVHVVFKRDAFDGFERIRSRVRRRLNVVEEPIDGGFETLVRLRDALAADHVVVMQGDRAMPGQRFQCVPFLSGKLRLPIGPVKLARLTGSPIIPVFVVRNGGRRFCIHLGTPIDIEAGATSVDGIDPAVLSLAQTLESFVSRYPTQWLVLDKAFAED